MKPLLKKLAPLLCFWLAATLFGISLVYNWAIPGLAAVAGLYAAERCLIQLSKFRYYLAVSFGAALAFLASTWWFMKIVADGWANRIWILPPSAWLLIMLSLCTGIAALLACLPRLALHRFAKTRGYPWLFLLGWAVCMLLSELLLSFGFSVLMRGNGVPAMPAWNFLSASLLVKPQSVFGTVLPVFGFWGTSYLIYVSVALITEVLNPWRKQVLWQRLVIPAAAAMGVAAVCYFGRADFRQPGQAVRATIIAPDASSNRYLESVAEHITKQAAGSPIVVVLPEYSGLLRPYPAGALSFNNKDFRPAVRAAAQGKSVYLVGTEDVYQHGRRHVETYVLNNRLETVKRRQKTFLVPGGEYLVPWIAELMKVFDERSVMSFYAERGRTVAKSIPPPKAADPFAGSLAIGACSTVLTPFMFRDQVAAGAEVLASNVSFAQFPKAPEYERYAQRFNAFTTRALERPMLLSSVAGQSYIMNEQGIITQHTKDRPITTEINGFRHQTLYAKLGDFNIILLILSLNALGYALYWHHTKGKKNP